ncbi:SprT family zinc-dependent metalloprotease [Thiothrix lacustris]|uniref:SprT family zinc-dependent metalloprotease n=1 Tax=Thiothrix lacustris TaxID=525917 RepID=A0ABY9MQD8_9GAMM|nr:SprT family zinc-dependent metalloprotease [Thiothrix lacustris]WML90807.1 SprT family zinc-dependent metalloprotease [Thiothrix lacustris]
MNTTNPLLTVSDIPVYVTRKAIKNLHLGVYPPDGQVRVSAPEHFSADHIRLAVVTRLKWIKTQQQRFQQQARQTPREMVSGEAHYLWGTRYRLEVVYQPGKHQVTPRGEFLHLSVTPGTSTANRERLLHDYYRQQLKQRIPVLLAKWQPRIGKQVTDWGIKRMKTKWGSCNITEQRIWLNLELAKKSPECLEYVLIHELAHLLERQHNANFTALMDEFLPQWRSLRGQLNAEYLSAEAW